MLLTDKLGSFKKRVVRKCYPFFVLPFFISLFFIPTAFAEETLPNKIKEVRLIAESGAVSLALQSIDTQQPPLNLNSSSIWLEWESERLLIYQLGQRWQQLQQRVNTYKKGLPENFYLWAKQQQVDALLTLKQGQHARQILLQLIWSKKAEAENNPKLIKQWLPLWQKRIIKSYLVDNEGSDAQFAAQRYYQDYSSNTIEDRLLRAHILLINQREDEVVDLLMKDTNHPEGGMLYLLAQLRSKARAPRKVYQSALRQMRGKWADNKLKYMLWAVAAESARSSGDLPSTANALEFVLAGNKNIELPAGLFNFSADTLWKAYLDYAVYLGNKSQFLIGNDQQWLNAAIKSQKTEPVKARSLFTMVMLKGQDNAAKLRAAKGFLNLMHKRKRGAQLIMKLFLKSNHFKTINFIPTPIRYDIVNIALSRSNVELASNLMTTIKVAPDGVDDYQWQLRRARIFVLGGKPNEGSNVLLNLLQKHKSFSKKQLERFLQVIFDLQTAKSHKLSFQVFQAVFPKVKDVHLQRELYYWMADSKKALQDYAFAARLYLRSALHAGNNGLDPWGQTARYQVAEMLTKAELYQDAHNFYQQLLKTTKEPARRAVLKHELKKLWLLRVPEVSKELRLSE